MHFIVYILVFPVFCLGVSYSTMLCIACADSHGGKTPEKRRLIDDKVHHTLYGLGQNAKGYR